MNAIRFYSTLFLFCIAMLATAQQHYKFRVYLKDKGTVNYSLDNPEQFLTKESITRKKRQNVKIDDSDFPISPDYFTLVQKAGGNIVSHSKWFKTFVVELNDSTKINDIVQLSFVDSAKYIWRGMDKKQQNFVRPRLVLPDCDESPKSENYFGITEKQFALHNAQNMALSGFTGKGMKVAVIDAGFTNTDVIPQFSGFAGYQNFVPSGDVFASSDHGTAVFSTMSLNMPKTIVGSAPAAKYWLLRSEDVASEFPVEEDYWVRAVEYADSIGVDVISTSLGYTYFDDNTLNYEHKDLDGKTSFMSLASDKAFEKGILMVSSAGNEGNKKWQKISPPGDAKYALTIGAVDTDSIIAPFSSKGFTADKRVKPDLVSVGFGTFVIGQNGKIRRASGTSFSTPFLAGLITSLWSVNPSLQRSEIVDIVKRSADRYAAPDSVFGYGIPDFGKAVPEILKTLKPIQKKISLQGWNIEPSASGNAYNITLVDSEYSFDAYSVTLLDENGKILHQHLFNEQNSVQIPISAEIKRENKFLHFVINEPFVQKTLRVKI